MRYITAAAAALNQTPMAWDHNQKNIISVIEKAKQRGVMLVCFPELCITGYGCEDAFLSLSTSNIAWEVLHAILPHTKDIAVAVGLPILFRDGLYNTAAWLVDGKIVGFVGKQNLAGQGLHYEGRWFKPWPTGLVTELVLSKNAYPIGDLVFSLNEIRIGFEICEDAWAATRTGVNLATRGVDIILNPSASHFAFGKSSIRKRFVQEGARAFGVAYIYANLLGNEAGRIIYDGDTIIAAAEGSIVAEGPRLSFQENILTAATIDVQHLRLQRASTLSYPKTSIEANNILECSSIKFRELKTNYSNQSMGAWEQSKTLKEEEALHALCLGLFDYLRKSRAQGFVLNLSGGADSSLCLSLIYYMLALSLQELGAEELANKLKYIVNIQKELLTFSKNQQSKNENKEKYEQSNIKLLMEKLVFCLYQRTVNNSAETLFAAQNLASALGANFAVFEIDHIVNEYLALMDPLYQRKLSFATDDLALQNVQARTRSPSAWLLANLRDALLICSSNRSEASVGYTTMDGDTAGGLCPIGGLDKDFISKFLKWMLDTGPLGLWPIRALEKVVVLIPTAELRPLEAHQQDEADLMPYEWLEMIDRLFVKDKRAPIEILNFMQADYPEVATKELAKAIDCFFKLWARNQWKRERLAPSFHMDDESVDPKTWCRFPILSGGFERELAEIRALLK